MRKYFQIIYTQNIWLGGHAPAPHLLLRAPGAAAQEFISFLSLVAKSCPTLSTSWTLSLPGKNTGVGFHFLLQGLAVQLILSSLTLIICASLPAENPPQMKQALTVSYLRGSVLRTLTPTTWLEPLALGISPLTLGTSS